jgi:hypothetical protein
MQRPRLSISVAHQVLCLAKMHSSKAVTYALQAMRTESQGLLHLIASDHPKEDAQQVRGRHLLRSEFAGCLSESGGGQSRTPTIPAQPVGLSEQWQEPELSMSDLPIAGRDWLAVMRLTQNIPLHDRRDWSEFSRTVNPCSRAKFPTRANCAAIVDVLHATEAQRKQRPVGEDHFTCAGAFDCGQRTNQHGRYF